MAQPATEIDLSGKTCLVTGANGGIGRATASYFAAAGARVLATDIGDDWQGDSPAHYRKIDLLTDEGLADITSWIAEEVPDILFNNARCGSCYTLHWIFRWEANPWIST